MPQADRRPRLIPALGTALLLALPGTAGARSSDRNEPVYIEADQATINEQEGSSSYSGNVSLRQGSLRLSGERMTVQLQDDRITTITLDGSPARFAQRPDGADSDQEAEAGHIEYNAASRRLLLEHDAHVRQVGKEEFSSDRIEFNLADNSVSAGGSDGRVRITLQPGHGGLLPEGGEPADGQPSPGPDNDAAPAPPAQPQ